MAQVTLIRNVGGYVQGKNILLVKDIQKKINKLTSS